MPRYARDEQESTLFTKEIWHVFLRRQGEVFQRRCLDNLFRVGKSCVEQWFSTPTRGDCTPELGTVFVDPVFRVFAREWVPVLWAKGSSTTGILTKFDDLGVHIGVMVSIWPL